MGDISLSLVRGTLVLLYCLYMAQANIVNDIDMLHSFSLSIKFRVLLTMYVAMDYQVVNVALHLILMLC